MTKQTYFGISRVVSDDVAVMAKNNLVEDAEDGALLGDRILEALHYGSNLGVEVAPTFDEDVTDDSETHEVDLLASPNHDFFDIAEATGHLVSSPGALPTEQPTED